MVLERAEEALALFEQLGDKRGRAQALLDPGTCMRGAATLRWRNTHLAQALALFRELGAHGSREPFACRDGRRGTRPGGLCPRGGAVGRGPGAEPAGPGSWTGRLESTFVGRAGHDARAVRSSPVTPGAERGNCFAARAMMTASCMGCTISGSWRNIRATRCAWRRVCAKACSACVRRHYDEIYGIGIAGMAAVAAAQGQLERAARLFGAAEAQQTL